MVETDLRSALRRYELVVEATPAGGIVHEEHVRAGTWVAAAGVPLGVTPEARARLGQKLIHDPLQIGVATMAVMAIAPLSAKNDLGGGRGQARPNKG